MRPATLWADNLQRAASPTTAHAFHPPMPAEPLPARRMHDSYSEIMLPFASQPKLLEAYVNASGGLQTGKLMEHLDSLAGGVAYKHVFGGDVVATVGDFSRAPVYMVTAAVDR
jgi:acyl-coenzyme A thioesterase 9